MERMTAKKDGHVYVINCPPCDVPHDVNVIIQQTADRLAAYEDTGLEPWDIRNQLESMLDCVALFFEITPDRLRELAEADREGRCVVLPRLEPGHGDNPGAPGVPGPPGIATEAALKAREQDG